MKEKSLLKNEDGSVLLLAVVILMLLTVMGISATTTSTIEVQIAANDALYKENFYLAEAAVMEAAQRIDDASDNDLLPASTTFSWLTDDTVDMDDPDIMIANSATSSIDPNTRYGVVCEGIAPGGSLDMASPTQLYQYAVYGIYSSNIGQAHISIGYRKRF